MTPLGILLKAGMTEFRPRDNSNYEYLVLMAKVGLLCYTVTMQISNIDQHLLASNINLSPEERLTQHQNALDLLVEIDKAKEQLNAKSK